jgi:hypothetical protein
MDRPEAQENEQPVPNIRADDQSTVGRPGDPLMDPKTSPGYILLGLGFISFALALVAAANDLNGWLMVAIAAFVVFTAIGLGWILYERGRMKKLMRDTPGGVPSSLRRKWRSTRGA